MPSASRTAALAALALTATLSGCGLGAGTSPRGVQLTVTSWFGAHTIGAFAHPRVSGEETVMSLLMRNARVGTSYGGAFVQSIDGHASSTGGAEPIGWFYFVNGVQAAAGAASTDVRSGDRIWWDLHDWSQSEESPAVVGSFPAPFATGLEGRRLPVRVECARASLRACRTVTARLAALGVHAGTGAIDTGAEPHTLRVLVGAWTAIRGSAGVNVIERGPRASGVYARFSASGAALTLLDAQGQTVGVLGGGAGILAATRHGADAPVWVVSGTDPAGVQRAARAFDAQELRNRFALAVSAAGTALSVPATRSALHGRPPPS